MITFKKTNATDADFLKLVKLLDAGLKVTDGDDHNFYDQFNKVDSIKHTIVAYFGKEAVGCGAFKAFDDYTVEIKRMYTNPTHRGKGIGKQILLQLEKWAKDLGYISSVLETGKNQVQALKFYPAANYKVIDNYAQYIGVENSVCFGKKLEY